jgi:hypothetical protein
MAEDALRDLLAAGASATEAAAAEPTSGCDSASHRAATGHDPAGDAAVSPAALRPADGGWWTLGGGRLPAMVWPLPALPPPETFVLLLDAEA